MKVLVATEKPFAKAAVDGIRNIVEGAGHKLALLEKYTSVEELFGQGFKRGCECCQKSKNCCACRSRI